MIRVLWRRPDGTLSQGGSELASASGQRWVDVQGQTAQDLDWLKETFGFHPLALEDCAQLDQRPKAEEYTGHLFVVVHAFSHGKTPEKLIIHELHAFLGADYLVTVHQDPMPQVEAIWARAVADPSVFARGADFVLYALCDAVVDSHFHVVDEMSEAIEGLEERILRRSRPQDIGRIFALKRSLILLRRVVSPTRDVVALLAKRGHPCISERTSFYFRDVFDHLVRVSEAIESDRDLIAGTFEAYLSVSANRTSDITKQLTLFASIFMPLSFTAGFFGMNFDTRVMGTAFPVVFYALLGAMVAVPVAMIAWFRHKGWM